MYCVAVYITCHFLCKHFVTCIRFRCFPFHAVHSHDEECPIVVVLEYDKLANHQDIPQADTDTLLDI